METRKRGASRLMLPEISPCTFLNEPCGFAIGLAAYAERGGETRIRQVEQHDGTGSLFSPPNSKQSKFTAPDQQQMSSGGEALTCGSQEVRPMSHAAGEGVLGKAQPQGHKLGSGVKRRQHLVPPAIHDFRPFWKPCMWNLSRE